MQNCFPHQTANITFYTRSVSYSVDPSEARCLVPRRKHLLMERKPQGPFNDGNKWNQKNYHCQWSVLHFRCLLANCFVYAKKNRVFRFSQLVSLLIKIFTSSYSFNDQDYNLDSSIRSRSRDLIKIFENKISWFFPDQLSILNGMVISEFHINSGLRVQERWPNCTFGWKQQKTPFCCIQYAITHYCKNPYNF